uniref:CDK5RAP3-like protein n=1 Tax=Rhabditophanes sp. KR3021 TaxID=114890 RepID=A0AC35TQH1_9BILA
MKKQNTLPIDINTNKLGDWLISRMHCERTWFEIAQTIRVKVLEALNELPDHPQLNELKKGTPFTYYHCLDVFEILKETEKDSKNILGFYSSPIYKKFSAIISLYQKKNIYLGETSQAFSRLCLNEVPYLKKIANENEKEIEFHGKKVSDYSKLAVDKKKEYEKELLKMKLEGKDLKNELLTLTHQLPAFFDEVIEEMVKFREIIKYFEDFSNFALGMEENCLLLPVSGLLLRKGKDVTVYEWKHGVEPIKIEKPTFNMVNDEPSHQSDEIDFGNDDIDFGDEDEIDFGDDINIEVVGDEVGIKEDGVARDDEALSLLEFPETNSLLISELKTLLFFLKMRLADENFESPADLLIGGLGDEPLLKKMTISDLKMYKEKVGTLMVKMTDEQKANLFKIKSSPHYVNVLVEGLEEKRGLEGKMLRLKELMEKKIESGIEKASLSKLELESMQTEIKYLKTHLEGTISKLYENRQINIMGAVNTALA